GKLRQSDSGNRRSRRRVLRGGQVVSALRSIPHLRGLRLVSDRGRDRNPGLVPMTGPIGLNRYEARLSGRQDARGYGGGFSAGGGLGFSGFSSEKISLSVRNGWNGKRSGVGM